MVFTVSCSPASSVVVIWPLITNPQCGHWQELWLFRPWNSGIVSTPADSVKYSPLILL
ncbi:hypothetical protein D3C72_2579490 [compost metagenome]